VTNGLKQSETHGVSASSTDEETEESSNIITASSTKSSFTDVETIPEKYFVDTLASHGIVKGTKGYSPATLGKFSPDNYTRLGDFIKIVIDTYRTKVGYDLNTDAGLTNKTYFMGGVVPISLQKAVNTAYELGFLDNVLTAAEAKESDFDLLLTSNIIDQMLTNIGKEFPGLVTKPKMGLSDLYVKRGVMTRYVVQGFDLAPLGNDFTAFHSTQKSYFTDINGNPYGTAIKTLADLGIVSSQNPKFYPDNYLLNYEFTVMLVNALLVSNDTKFNPASYQDSATSFVDLDAKASYTPWVKYAEKKDLISYLTVTLRGQNFFNPNKAISKLEVYHILEDVTGLQVTYNKANADQLKMTRGEFASILVQAFDFQAASTDNSNIESQVQTTEEDT